MRPIESCLKHHSESVSMRHSVYAATLLMWAFLAVPVFGQEQPPLRDAPGIFDRVPGDERFDRRMDSRQLPNQLAIEAEVIPTFRFNVKTPTGEPAALAVVEEYRGQLIHIAFNKDGKPQVNVPTGQQTLPVPGTFKTQPVSLSIDPDGTFAAEIEKSGTKLVVVHETGYAVHPVIFPAATIGTKSDSPQDIQLQSWGKASGVVQFNDQPIESGRLAARWESFPFGPAMMMLPAEKRIPGPALFSITEGVTTDANGRYELTKLPPGRVKVSVLTGPASEATVGDDSTVNPSVRESIRWWQTVESVADVQVPPNSLLFPPETFAFSTISVRGRFKLTDELVRCRTLVQNTPNGLEVSSVKLRVAFASTKNVIAAEWQPVESMTLEKAIRDSVVWGRVGGKREAEDPAPILATVDDDGAFECTLPRGEYRVMLMLPSQGRIDEPSGNLVVERLTGVATSAPVISPDDGEDTVFDLGELEFAPKADVTPMRPMDSDDPFSELRPGTGMPRMLGPDDMYEQNVDFGNSANAQRRPNADPRSAPDIDRSWDRTTPLDPGIRQPLAANGFRAPDFVSNANRFPKLDRSLGVPERRPDDRSVAQPAATAPVDQSIARLVTDLLAAGDRRTRDNMRQPLQKLLEQKFDAEQQAREGLVKQLSERLKEASLQVTERKQDRDRIVREQLQRMMSLPEDSFLPMEPVDDSSYFTEDMLPAETTDPGTLNRRSATNTEFDFDAVEPYSGPLKAGNWHGNVVVLFFRKEAAKADDKISKLIKTIYDPKKADGLQFVEVLPNDDTLSKQQPWTTTYGTLPARFQISSGLPCIVYVDHLGRHKLTTNAETTAEEVNQILDRLFLEQSQLRKNPSFPPSDPLSR